MPDGAFHLPRRRASCAPARSGLECGPRRTERRSPIRVLATEHRHGSVERALRFLALGTAALVALATDADECVTVDVVVAALQASDAPTIVHRDAADLNVGAIDRSAALVPIACAAGALVHVDGAFDLWARASSRRRDEMAGVELAHFWAADAHKWLNTPKDIGMAVIADPEAHLAAMTISAAYIAHDSSTHN